MYRSTSQRHTVFHVVVNPREPITDEYLNEVARITDVSRPSRTNPLLAEATQYIACVECLTMVMTPIYDSTNK